MAYHKSAIKRIRRNAHRAEINTSRLSRVRSFVRKVDEAIAAGDQGAALSALREAEPELMRGANHGVVHASAASRKVSRLARRIKAMAPA